jgi:anti-sigma factor RsiW
VVPFLPCNHAVPLTSKFVMTAESVVDAVCAGVGVQMGTKLSCREFVAFLGEYLSGGLAPEQLAVFNAHLACCPSCVNYTNTYRQAVRLGRAALGCDDGPVPTDVPDQLVQAVLAARARTA